MNNSTLGQIDSLKTALRRYQEIGVLKEYDIDTLHAENMTDKQFGLLKYKFNNNKWIDVRKLLTQFKVKQK